VQDGAATDGIQDIDDEDGLVLRKGAASSAVTTVPMMQVSIVRIERSVSHTCSPHGCCWRVVSRAAASTKPYGQDLFQDRVSFEDAGKNFQCCKLQAGERGQKRPEGLL